MRTILALLLITGIGCLFESFRLKARAVSISSDLIYVKHVLEDKNGIASDADRAHAYESFSELINQVNNIEKGQNINTIGITIVAMSSLGLALNQRNRKSQPTTIHSTNET
jgi:hypothetical protein